ncbi:MAG: radical SAM protein [candidate division Zixibacteria bacterium SM23_73_3]|nr:MAG: radical SAM protein [candidate division Zixibacteria bacterium SM23_73_3]
MKIIAKIGEENIALVYIAEMEDGKVIEFVESVQPPIPREKKWVLTLSTLYGCPVGCRFCDAGSHYEGKLSKRDMISQIDYLITSRFPDKVVPVQKFKIQFARMGDPSFNQDVLDVLQELPELYDAPGLLPSLSTVAPEGTDRFFEKLLEIKKKFYKERFQLQFSIHTTDIKKRNWLVPVNKWDFEKIAEYGKAFYKKGERKLTLNFALADGMPVKPDVLLRHFNPDKFLIKITPVNPTCRASANKIFSCVLPDEKKYEIIDALNEAGYEVILSIGELAENDIGSNCGQHVTSYLKERDKIKGGYTFPLQIV